MPTLRRYCERFGICVEIDDEEECLECLRLGSSHMAVPMQNKCCEYAAITENSGGPCVLDIGHEGPHVPHPEQVQKHVDKGDKVWFFELDEGEE